MLRAKRGSSAEVIAVTSPLVVYDQLPDGNAVKPVAAELGMLGEKIRILRMRAVDERGRDHDEPARLDACACVEHVHRADIFELVRPFGGVRRMREKRAVHERVDVRVIE